VIWRFDDVELDTEAYELRRGGAVVPVEPQVFDVLVHLISHRHRVVAKTELLDAVWGDRFVSESALSSRIKSARRAVGDDGRAQRLVRTVHGRGYRFVGDVDAEPAPGIAIGSAGSGPTDGSPPAGGSDQGPPAGFVPTPPPGATTRYCRSGGYDIAYQVLGDGPDLVFIPGFVSNIDLHWEHPGMAGFFGRLASFSRLILFDKRGTGVSERVPADRLPTLEERMDDVRAVMDAVGSERASIFGISEGGPMSLLLSAVHPERVERLILYGTFAREPFDRPRALARAARDNWGTGQVLAGLAPSWAGAAAHRRFLARFERQSASPEAAGALIRMTSETDASATLASIGAPTLVLHRRDDAIIPLDRAEALAAGIPGAELVVLEGADHFVAVDPGEVLDRVERFVTGVAPGPRPVRELVTMLFVDVVGSTERAASLGDRRWRDVLADLRDRADRHLAAHGGRLVTTMGDGFLATFHGPARAVRCGLALAGELGDAGVPVRAGVHTSEVERLGDDLAGIGVHVAARVQALADPGEVLVTRTVRDLVVGSGLVFEPRGEHQLAGVPDSWELFAARS
jgi:pimeloyl-ACP methyl ester carboxylesterase/DNA-binding winged helix-turn-helix (wHTH) protein